MIKFDIIQLIGNATCNNASSFLTEHQACSMAESWNFGAIIVVAAFAALTLRFIATRRQERRENNYYW